MSPLPYGGVESLRAGCVSLGKVSGSASLHLQAFDSLGRCFLPDIEVFTTIPNWGTDGGGRRSADGGRRSAVGGSQMKLAGPARLAGGGKGSSGARPGSAPAVFT